MEYSDLTDVPNKMKYCISHEIVTLQTFWRKKTTIVMQQTRRFSRIIPKYR